MTEEYSKVTFEEHMEAESGTHGVYDVIINDPMSMALASSVKAGELHFDENKSTWVYFYGGGYSDTDYINNYLDDNVSVKSVTYSDDLKGSEKKLTDEIRADEFIRLKEQLRNSYLLRKANGN